MKKLFLTLITLVMLSCNASSQNMSEEKIFTLYNSYTQKVIFSITNNYDLTIGNGGSQRFYIYYIENGIKYTKKIDGTGWYYIEEKRIRNY